MARELYAENVDYFHDNKVTTWRPNADCDYRTLRSHVGYLTYVNSVRSTSLSALFVFRELYAYNFDYFWWNKVTSRRPNADREGENMKYIQFKCLHLGAKSGQGQSSRRLQDVTNVGLMPWSMNTLVLITNERQNLTFTDVLVTLIVELRWSAFSCAER